MNHIAESPQFLFNCSSDTPPDPLLITLQELATLPYGWRYGEGIPPQQTAIQIAKEIYLRLADFRLQADAFPSADGSLSLVFYADKKSVEINISKDGNIDLSIEEGEGFDFEEIENMPDVSTQEAIYQVTLLVRKSYTWNWSGFSIQENTINDQSVSEVPVSLIRAMEQESRWSTPDVSENTLLKLEYANT